MFKLSRSSFTSTLLPTISIGQEEITKLRIKNRCMNSYYFLIYKDVTFSAHISIGLLVYEISSKFFITSKRLTLQMLSFIGG